MSSRPNPLKSNRSSPSRLAIPRGLRASSSLTNLRVLSQNGGTSTVSDDIPPVPPFPATHALNSTLHSSASSVANLDLNEGILIQDIGSELDSLETDDVVQTRLGDEEAKKSLRDKLRRTLSHRPSRDVVASRSRPALNKGLQTSEISITSASKYLPREYFVLTDAGKPVFTSRPGDENVDSMTSTIAIMQALISVFIDDNDKLRCINAGNTRITFLMRSPLYYACASSWGEPEFVTRSHLEYLHLQIISIVSAAQLRKVFERRTNFDLRRLLNGAETFLLSLLERLEFDLHCLKLDAGLRKRIAETLVPTTKMKDVLYVILVGRGRVITLIRPKKHSIHPSDVHILLNTIHSPSIVNSPASSSWIPVCLPKFKPEGFVNAYISFMRKDQETLEMESDRRSTQSGSTVDEGSSTPQNPVLESGIAFLITFGAGADSVTDRLQNEGTLDALANAIFSGQTDYTVSDLSIPGLRHFIYKSRSNVQVTFPTFEDPYDSPNERRRLVTLYQTLHDSIHAKSGQQETLKLQYIRTEKECVMGWITQPFELYLSLSPLLPKSAVVGAANAVARWVKKEEFRLFLKDAPVF
ncbi:trafficking protein Mon1-domain-containing protein [Mycena floridula]|nr:trafficking protein Mon1-domain-containing protein [Mycena floridula]